MAKHKFASISLTVRDRAISSKFSTHRVSEECTLCNFQKFASISLTVRDRAISSKFSTHRVSKECTLCNFPKIFPSPKMEAILKFRIFAKKERFRRNFRPTGYLRNVLFYNFPKIFPSPKMAAILKFRIFAKNGKTQICFYLLNRAR